MATKHNFQTMGPLSYYKPTAPNKGSFRTCYSENEVTVAQQDGFTSKSYVFSEWPKTVYQAKTGKTKPVGKLEWTDEQNAAAVAALGSDWGVEHVAEPEPVPEKKQGDSGGGIDIAALLQLGGQIALLTDRLAALEGIALQSDQIRASQEKRIAELEEAMSEPVGAPAEKKGK